MRGRKGAWVQHLATISPVPAAPAGGASIAWWLVAVVVLAVIVAGGFVLTSRR